MSKICVRALEELDAEQVSKLDKESYSHLLDYLDSENYVWGIFNETNELIGYCTIGGAEDSTTGYLYYPFWTKDSLILSDVFVSSKYRSKGYAIRMLNETLKLANPNQYTVFLTVLDDRLRRLYEKVGFKYIEDGCMVLLNDKLRHSFDNIDYLRKVKR